MLALKRAFAILFLCGAVVPPSALAQETWSLQATPNAGEASTPNQLFEVGCDPSGLAACTAVGARGNLSMALRWDGVSWTYQPTPIIIGASAYRLFGVDCPSATRCLAVGNSETPFSSPRPAPLAEIWNGSGWTKQTTPAPSGASSAELTDIGCNNTAECIAVGSAMVGGVKTAVAEKWKSPTWTLQSVPVPAEAKSSQLDGIACRWSNYCVAVGRYTTGTGATKSLAMFWNGSNWSLQTLGDPVGATQGTLLDVACTGQPTVCMAVGGWKNGNDGNKQFPLAYRFNGSTWTLQNTASPSTSIASVFQDVSCKSITSCAAVGSWVSSSGGSNQTLAENWDGSTWSIESTPNAPGASFSAFFGIECRTRGCMGVGYSTNSSGVNRTLSELRVQPAKQHLTYAFGFGPFNGDENFDWEAAVQRALLQWSQRTPLTFTQIQTPILEPDKADLYFSWEWEYETLQPFDGVGGKAVKAFGPLESQAGDVYFDDNESWNDNCSSGSADIDIQSVAENAVEHALGISGSTGYETDRTRQCGLTMAQWEGGVAKFGNHPSQRRYFLRNSNTEGPPDIVFQSPADGPDSEFSGDWNGDGKDTVGWYEQHSGLCGVYPFGPNWCPDRLFLYSAPHTSGVNTPEEVKYREDDQEIDDTRDYLGVDRAKESTYQDVWYYEDGEFRNVVGDHMLDFGEDGDIPVVGDWDGNGLDGVGIFRRSNSTFYLSNSTTTGIVDIVIPSFALPGDQPVVGDWNGDGKDTIGVYRPAFGFWILNDQNENNAAEHVFHYGNVGGWVRIVGDWNGDGIDTPGFAQD